MPNSSSLMIFFLYIERRGGWFQWSDDFVISKVISGHIHEKKCIFFKFVLSWFGMDRG